MILNNSLDGLHQVAFEHLESSTSFSLSQRPPSPFEGQKREFRLPSFVLLVDDFEGSLPVTSERTAHLVLDYHKTENRHIPLRRLYLFHH